MRPLAIFCSLLLLAICAASCTQRPPVLHRAEISVIFEQMDGASARWDHHAQTIRLSAIYSHWSIAHELGHAADSNGESYDAVALKLGNIVSMPHEMATVRAVQREARRIGGPDAHWKALRKLYGPQAVGHSEILARIR